MSNQEPVLGRNRTGIQMSPVHSKEMIEGIDNFSWDNVPTSAEDPEGIEMDSLRNAHAVGSIPVPLTVKGMAKTGLEKIKGDRPELFVDKLGERLAFERSGVRLYEALLRKCMAENSLPPAIDIVRLETIRNEELEHMFLIKHCIEHAGADPTALTPSADVAGVSSLGALQVISDPRTSISQSLEAILMIELADHDGWDLLIDIARSQGQDKAAQNFMDALQAEARHVVEIRKMLKGTLLGSRATQL